jgi:hypothetical protein
VLVALQAAQAFDAPTTRADTNAAAIAADAAQAARTAYGKLPLVFVANAGQTDARLRYTATGAGFKLGFADNEALLAFTKGTRGHALALRFLGAGTPQLEPRRPLPGRVNYLLGHDRSNWRTGQLRRPRP